MFVARFRRLSSERRDHPFLILPALSLLMRGEPLTYRKATLTFAVYDCGVGDPDEKGSVTASRRLAAHRNGRARGLVAL